jgi:hypothetical protein
MSVYSKNVGAVGLGGVEQHAGEVWKLEGQSPISLDTSERLEVNVSVNPEPQGTP